MEIAKTLSLFVVTALAEIIGCYLPYLWLREGKSFWLLLPAAISLVVFVWLLTLHPQAAGRVYAAYGGVYISVALMWLWGVGHSTNGYRLDWNCDLLNRCDCYYVRKAICPVSVKGTRSDN